MHQLSTLSPPSDSDQGQPAYLCQSAFLLISLTSFSHNSWARQWNPYARHEPQTKLAGKCCNIASYWCNKISFLHPNDQVILQTLKSQFFQSNISCLLPQQLPHSTNNIRFRWSAWSPPVLRKLKVLNNPLPLLPHLFCLYYYNLSTGSTF